MIRLRDGVLAGPQPTTRSDASRTPWHLHHYSYAGADAFSGSSLYRCRCGVVRPAI